MNLVHFAIDDLQSIVENTSDTKLTESTIKHFRTLLLANGYDIDFEESKLAFFTVDALREILTIIQLLKGTNVAHKRLIASFPGYASNQLLSSYTSWLNYLTGSLLTSNETEYNELDVKAHKFIKLKLTTLEEVRSEVLKVIYSKVPLKLNHEELVSMIYSSEDEIISQVDVNKIDLKEVLAYQIVYELNNGLELSARNATDIARAISLVSGCQDAKLDTAFNVKSLTSKQRKLVIKSLNNVATIDDVVRNKSVFKRIFFMLHIGSSKYKQYENIQAIANQVRNVNNPETSRTILEDLVQKPLSEELVNIFRKDPNELALRLDHILRVNSDISVQRSIVTLYKYLATNISTKMNLRVLAYFKNRDVDRTTRVIYTKGINGQVLSVPANLEKLPDEIRSGIVLTAMNAVVTSYEIENRIFDKAYIHPSLFSIRLPANMTNSDSSKTLARGSRVKIDDANVVRLFTHWKGDVDVDLSVYFLDEKFNYEDSISFSNLSNYYTIHSGDVRAAPDGGTEYVDITLSKLPKQVRYGIVFINIWAGSGSFDEVTELFGGFMLRDNAKTKDIYDARTLDNKFTINGTSKACMPYLIDFHTNELVWLNINKNIPNGWGVTTGVNESMQEIVDVLNRKFVSVGELIAYHSDNYIMNVDDIDDNTVVFDKEFAYNIRDINELI